MWLGVAGTALSTPLSVMSTAKPDAVNCAWVKPLEASHARYVGPLGWVLYIDVPGGRETAVPLTGTTDWRAVRVRVKVPAEAHKVSIGAMLLDGGTGWLDAVKLNVVEP